jgi:hypothetical protein
MMCDLFSSTPMELLQTGESALHWCEQSVEHASISSGDFVHFDDVWR